MSGDLARLRALSDAATPGDWESLDNGDRLVAWRMTDAGFDDDFEYVVDEPISNGDNAAFIAASANYVRALLHGEGR